MSLNVGIGDLALFLAEPSLEAEEIAEFRETYASLDRFLRQRGLGGHIEPETLPAIVTHSKLQSFPSWDLHRLRRAFVYHRSGLPLTPAVESRDAVLEAEYANPSFVSHLVHFSDAEGFYVPIDFPEPIVAAPGEAVLGGIVGSSPRLKLELEELAPALGIELQNGRLSAEAAVSLGDVRVQHGHPFGTERLIWLILFEAAWQSVKLKSAIRLG